MLLLHLISMKNYLVAPNLFNILKDYGRTFEQVDKCSCRFISRELSGLVRGKWNKFVARIPFQPLSNVSANLQKIFSLILHLLIFIGCLKSTKYETLTLEKLLIYICKKLGNFLIRKFEKKNVFLFKKCPKNYLFPFLISTFIYIS